MGNRDIYHFTSLGKANISYAYSTRFYQSYQITSRAPHRWGFTKYVALDFTRHSEHLWQDRVDNGDEISLGAGYLLDSSGIAKTPCYKTSLTMMMRFH